MEKVHKNATSKMRPVLCLLIDRLTLMKEVGLRNGGCADML